MNGQFSPDGIAGRNLLGGRRQVAGGAESRLYAGGNIPRGCVLKVCVDGRRAAHEAEALARFAEFEVGAGFLGVCEDSGILLPDCGQPGAYVVCEPGGPLFFGAYDPDPNLIDCSALDHLEAALSNLHSAGISHNDISPKNFVYRRRPDKSFRPVLVDMGWAVLPDRPINADKRALDSELDLDGSFGAYDRRCMQMMRIFLTMLRWRRFSPGCRIRDVMAAEPECTGQALPFCF